MVNTFHEGSFFEKLFASLEKGRLCIYKNEEEYNDYEAPLVEPFDMAEYRLEVDLDVLRKHSEKSSNGHFRKRFSGHNNLTLRQTIALVDGVDLVEASKKYVFNLVPKVNDQRVYRVVTSTDYCFE